MLHLTLYFFALFCLSTAPNWAKLNQMPAETLGFWRLTIATFILFAIIKLYKKEKFFVFNQHSRWIIISGFFFFLHLWTYKFASKNTLVSSTMILFATNPIWASLGGFIFFKEKLSIRMIISYFIAFLGIYLLVKDQLHISAQHTLGNSVALVSALFYALYMLSGKKARQHFSNWTYSSLQYLVCALCFFIVVLIRGGDFLEGSSPVSWISVVGLVLLPTLFGHFSMTYLVKKMNLGLLTCGKLIEPLIASMLAYFIFAEHLSPMAGVAFVLASIAVVNLFWPNIKQHFRR